MAYDSVTTVKLIVKGISLQEWEKCCMSGPITSPDINIIDIIKDTPDSNIVFKSN